MGFPCRRALSLCQDVGVPAASKRRRLTTSVASSGASSPPPATDHRDLHLRVPPIDPTLREPIPHPVAARASKAPTASGGATFGRWGRGGSTVSIRLCAIHLESMLYK